MRAVVVCDENNCFISTNLIDSIAFHSVNDKKNINSDQFMIYWNRLFFEFEHIPALIGLDSGGAGVRVRVRNRNHVKTVAYGSDDFAKDTVKKFETTINSLIEHAGLTWSDWSPDFGLLEEIVLRRRRK